MIFDIAAIIAAIATALGTTGAGLKFLWNKIEKRIASIEGALEECREREGNQKIINAKQLTVIELLWSEVERRSKGAAPVLGRSRKLLDDLKQSAIERELIK